MLDSPMPFQNTMWNGIPTQTTKLHPHIWLDATYVKCRRGSRMASTAVVTAIGCDESGWRQVLSASVVDTESYDSWLGSWQLRHHVGRIVSSVFRAGDATTAVVMYHAACEMLEGCCPRAERVLEEAEPDALAYLDFPTSHWKRLRTNNVQERANREIKRRSRVVQVFPSEKSLLRLMGAVLCDQAEAWSDSHYFSERKMAEMHNAELRKGASGCHDWAELEETARKMVESSFELADRVDST